MGRRGGFTLVDLLQVFGWLALMLSAAAFVLPSFMHIDNYQYGRRASCQSHLKEISIGLIAYVQDYDQRLPLIYGDRRVASGSFGWAGAAQPYLKNTSILQCPSQLTPATAWPNSPDYTHYWFNSNLSGKSEQKLNWVSNIFLLGDGAGGRASYAIRRPEAGPNYTWMNRHLSGANYAFVDGHVKWLKPELVTTAAASASVFTFAT